MKTVFALVALMIGSLAYANEPKTALERVLRAKSEITRKANEALQKKMAEDGGSGVDEKITLRMSSLKCLDAEPSGFEPFPIGTCVVSGGKMQLAAEFAINVRQHDIEVSLLNYDVE